MSIGLAAAFKKIVSKQMLTEQFITAGGGALAGGAYIGLVGLVTHKKKAADGTEAEAYFFDTRVKRGLLAGLLTFVGGGIAHAMKQPKVANGIAGAMGGAIGSEVVGFMLMKRREAAMKKDGYAGMTTPAVTLGEGAEAERALQAALRGANGLPEEAELAQLNTRGGAFGGSDSVEDVAIRGRGHELAGSSVEEEGKLGAWLGGY